MSERERLQNYIEGRFVAPVRGEYLPVYEPATGRPFAEVASSDRADVDAACIAAGRAARGWRETPVEKRAVILDAIANKLEAQIERFAGAESKDNGKPVSLARAVDIPRAVSNFRFFAGAVQHFASECHPTSADVLNYTLRAPLGVVGCISPWNLPLYLFTWKIAPALASGNCVVAKPSEITPVTATMFAELCGEAGLPPGVLNLVHGTGPDVGEVICTHPTTKAISFTGGTKTGARIASVAAPLFKKLSLELGGKNPVLVFDDCAFDEMLATTLRSSFSNQGEICLCGSRIFVQDAIYERFKTEFVARAKKLRVGDPLEPTTEQGALVSEQHHAKVRSYLDLARKEGGTVLCGGEVISPPGRCANGWFLSPVVIEGLPHNCRTSQEEIFGPVASLYRFKTEDEAVALANDTPYGLASVVWTRSLDRAHRVAASLHAGITWVNCWMVRDLRTPFGGVKQSGVGREGGWEALRFFTEPKNVCLKLS
ncbi:2-hydroxymuconic semialdehyde dehydrogenase : 5-carboxymethyl-2-hydroxymuconate semialdehyde dehydrogenase OS=Fulvivirga imtechensis AK7 GN=C900_03217 PE=3 SV=1: Aldedh [Gemmata massiliana]|uniref:Aldehyde dehydrogenase domain-containing protein n=1 Tax=Gemmata massiliana TaxID=1210884 RepID=A0A6P2DHJ1_9BACT|nr:aldehyde dehydrogenase [Gemmata massiliana]VTS01183.1 2-hydroxymuconic semialdehyde dehydrogenase : 5-carboxymethyl-2-hydroxymuconate semialdehyde dehydrogenase OS=Fulvivirga imtechensis AK7 GN=C900_03217 PE=3 SV=1: Aldedh [Gemmata massiliana]